MVSLTLDLSTLFEENARHSELALYLHKVQKQLQPGVAEITLTGRAPAWLYLHVYEYLRGYPGVQKICIKTPQKTTVVYHQAAIGSSITKREVSR